MRKFALPAVVAALIGSGAAGCGASVHTTTMPGVNLSNYRTFAFAPPKGQDAMTPAAQTVRDRVTADLAAKGIRRVDQNPDFLVSGHVVLEEKVAVDDVGPYDYYPADVSEYTQGTLVIDFVDPRTNKIFWRGTATQVVEHPDNPDLGKVAAAVDGVMKKYPAQVASAGPIPQM